MATADNIKRVLALAHAAAQRTPTVVVVSALSGVTDALIDAGRRAAAADASYREHLQVLEQRHLDVVRSYYPSRVKVRCSA